MKVIRKKSVMRIPEDPVLQRYFQREQESSEKYV